MGGVQKTVEKANMEEYRVLNFPLFLQPQNSKKYKYHSISLSWLNFAFLLTVMCVWTCVCVFCDPEASLDLSNILGE